jgi:post-segregation antitoxin (ccd killing protein)
MTQKQDAVLYLDKVLVSKARELGLDLSKMVENHLSGRSYHSSFLFLLRVFGISLVFA